MISVPNRDKPTTFLPFGFLYMLTYLKSMGYEVDFIDWDMN